MDNFKNSFGFAYAIYTLFNRQLDYPFVFGKDKSIKTYGSKRVQNYSPSKWKEINNSKKNIGRNDICYCGSGIKYKNCCLKKEDALKTKLKSFNNYTPLSFKLEISKMFDIEIDKIIFFGSRVFGDYKEGSDLDVAILSKPLEKYDESKIIKLGGITLDIHWLLNEDEELVQEDLSLISWIKNNSI